MNGTPDPGLAVALVTAVGLLAKIIYEQMKGDTPGAYERRFAEVQAECRRAAEESGGRHERLRTELIDASGKAAAASAAALRFDQEQELVRTRLHELGNVINAAAGKISVVDERTMRFAEDIKSLERHNERMTEKMDTVLRLMPRALGV